MPPCTRKFTERVRVMSSLSLSLTALLKKPLHCSLPNFVAIRKARNNTSHVRSQGQLIWGTMVGNNALAGFTDN